MVAADLYEQAAHEQWAGTVSSFDSVVTDDDEIQPGDFWRVTLGSDPAQQERLVGNVAASLSKADPPIRKATYGEIFPDPTYRIILTITTADVFTKIDKDLGARIKDRDGGGGCGPSSEVHDAAFPFVGTYLLLR